MAKPAPRLGKGLNALVRPRPPQTEDRRAAMDAAGVQELAVDSIRPNPRQPRRDFPASTLEELAASIRAKGVIQPVLVRPAGEGRYQLVAGERRWRATRLAGLGTIPAIVRPLSDAEALEVALVENLQREDLNAIERAVAYQEYLETFDVTADELARRLGESRPTISNYLRILKLGGEIRRMISTGELGMGQARALVGVEDPQRQLRLARLAIRRNLSVRQVEELVKGSGEARPAIERAALPNRHLQDVQTNLSKALGLPVRLQPGKKKNAGRIIIQYRNLDEFDAVANRLGISDAAE